MKLAAKLSALLMVGFLILFGVDSYLVLRRDIELFDDDMQLDALRLSEKLGPLIAA